MADDPTSRLGYLCKTWKPQDASIARMDDRHYGMCRGCVSEARMRRRQARREALHHTDTHRTCYLCRRFLPTEQFTQRSNGTFFSACKNCIRHVFAQRQRARR